MRTDLSEPCTMQGFPRADIDVASIRRDRHRYACLTNDVNGLVSQLATGLEELHALARTAQVNQAPPFRPDLLA